MTNKEISAVACEYAEEVMLKDFSDIEEGYTRDKVVALIIDDTEQVIRFMLRRFYLADKENAKALYNGDTFGELDFLEIVSCRKVLKSLFPEIAKEVDG